MARIVAGVAAGLLAWIVVVTASNVALRAVLRGYAEAEAAMNFTLAMLLFRLFMGALSSFGAGLVTAWVAKRGPAVKILAAVLLVVFIPLHYALWDKFPLWYHVSFLLSLVLVTILGATCYLRFARWTSERAANNAGTRPSDAA